MANIFNSVKIKLQRKNKFNLSFASRLTTEFGRLTPFLCEEVLPNDTFKLSTAIRVQFAPMKFPVMQVFTAYLHYHFVPRRLLMKNWEEFITGGEDGVSDVHYPTFALTEPAFNALDDRLERLFGPSSLFDYLGFPTIDFDDYDNIFKPGLGQEAAAHQIDILPFKAYQCVYNNWYRDQNLTDEVPIFEEDEGIINLLHNNPDGYQAMGDLFELRQRAFRKDYFTSALPDPQRGPDVTLPILGEIDIEGTGKFGVMSDTLSVGTGSDNDQSPIKVQSSGGSNMFVAANDPTGMSSGEEAKILGEGERSNIAAGLSGKIVDSEGDPTLRSATINEVRRAFAIQRWYELAARAGNRYIESILAHFGIRSSDARLQRPEYLGGSVVPVNVGDILQTSESGDTPLGTPAGIAQAAGRSKYIKFTAEEHGYLLGILSIIPEASYPQGLPRKFSRRDKFDFAWPLLANIGEQEIQCGELFFDYTETPGSNRVGFGYAPRYSEYKFGLGQVHGDFRTSLRDFHDARFFDERPHLNTEFIEVSTQNDGDSGLNRIFAVTESTMTDHLWVSLYNDIRVRRVLPKYGTPV